MSEHRPRYKISDRIRWKHYPVVATIVSIDYSSDIYIYKFIEHPDFNVLESSNAASWDWRGLENDTYKIVNYNEYWAELNK